MKKLKKKKVNIQEEMNYCNELREKKETLDNLKYGVKHNHRYNTSCFGCNNYRINNLSNNKH